MGETKKVEQPSRFPYYSFESSTHTRSRVSLSIRNLTRAKLSSKTIISQKKNQQQKSLFPPLLAPRSHVLFVRFTGKLRDPFSPSETLAHSFAFTSARSPSILRYIPRVFYDHPVPAAFSNNLSNTRTRRTLLYRAWYSGFRIRAAGGRLNLYVR